MIPPAQVLKKTQSEEFDLVSCCSKTGPDPPGWLLPSMADLKGSRRC
jgi:hypothetical protein